MPLSPPRIQPLQSPPRSRSASPKSSSPKRSSPKRSSPKRSSPPRSSLRKIKGGRQADIYVDDALGILQKEFKTNAAANVAEQQRFLSDNAASNHVPRLISADPALGILRMQYLQGYEQVKRALPQIKRAGAAEQLLRAIDAARRRLRRDRWYEDLANLTNILVKPDAAAPHGGAALADAPTPYGFDIQFVEGGRESPIVGDVETNHALFLKEVIREGHLGGLSLAKLINADKPWQ